MTTSRDGGDDLEDLVRSLRPTLSPDVDEWIEDPVTWVLRDDAHRQSLCIVAVTDGEFDVTVGEGVHTARGLTRSELEPLVSLLGVEMLFTARSAAPWRWQYLSLGDGTPVLAREAAALGPGRTTSPVAVPSTADHIAALRSEFAPLVRRSVTESTEHDRWRLHGRRHGEDLSIGYGGGSTIEIELGDSSTELVDFPKRHLPGILERFDGSESSWMRSSLMGIPVSVGVVFADGHRVPWDRFHRVLSRMAREERIDGSV
ncbi:hypothetical protein ACMT9U_04340 [Clavibacter sp. Sh2036]|uniref:hypothetical protein n=1 Tax=Clavibacter sp. Sh2036 TaxID=3397677 RepID=UPI0039E1EC40